MGVYGGQVNGGPVNIVASWYKFEFDNYIPEEEGVVRFSSGELQVYKSGTWQNISTGSSVGEANTASNVGTSGTGIFKQKTGVDLELYKLNALTSNLTIALDGTDKIDFSVNSNVDGGSATSVYLSGQSIDGGGS